MLEEQEEMINRLSEPVLSYILARLEPRYLARSRCVCKLWCTVIDDNCFLRSNLLPLSFAGIFINFHDLFFSEFFSRSLAIPILSDYLPIQSKFTNHCNGLLLLKGNVFNSGTLEWMLYVVNPATRQWVQLPPPSPPSLHFGSENLNFSQQACLVFDPTLSPHYEVFLIPRANAFKLTPGGGLKLESTPAIEELEWPLPSCKLHVFSSRTKGWEERSFVREGQAAGTVADMRLDRSYRYACHNSVYWRDALYVHCQTSFVMRISLLDGKYQVINPPTRIGSAGPYPHFYLGKSQKGVYCALDLSSGHYVYVLDGSGGQMDWVLKAHISLRTRRTYRRAKPWTLQDVNYQYYSVNGYVYGSSDEEIMEQEYECKFDNSSVAEIEEWAWASDNDDMMIETNEWDFGTEEMAWATFLGFHPFKEVVFLSEGSEGRAYHLNSSLIQDIGKICPADHMGHHEIEGSFAYTPWLGELPEEN